MIDSEPPKSAYDLWKMKQEKDRKKEQIMSDVHECASNVSI